MASTDVSVSVSGPGIGSIVATGAEVRYSVNAIPVCIVYIDPVASPNVLYSPDAFKRLGVCTINIQVKGRQGLNFQGFFDGISVSQSVGALHYGLVFKGQQQLLLEANTQLPGISPYGINALTPLNGMTVNGATDPTQTLQTIGALGLLANCAGLPMTEVYKQLALVALKNQTGSGLQFVATNKLLNCATLPQVINNPGRIAKLQSAIATLNNLNVSFVTSIGSSISVGNADIGLEIGRHFVQGPASLWENLLSFYSTIGCLMICSSNNTYVIPNNGFITVSNTAGGHMQQSTRPNYGFPADYTSFSYNDNGYVDVGYVALVSQVNTPHDGSTPLPVYQGGYPPVGGTSSSPGSALLIMDASPLLTVAPSTTGDPPSTSDQSNNNTSGKSSNVSGIQNVTNFNGTVTQKANIEGQRLATWASNLNKYGDNQAQIKFLQARYGDRAGSITLRFTPTWVPGTTGGIAINQPTGQYLNFMVQSVCHRVDVNPASQGTAVTNVEFNCGRVGQSPESVGQDALYQYGPGQVSSVQQSWIGDTT